MPPAGVNKATAVDFAAKMFKIEKDNIYTAGDNYNDIMMLQEYHGYAMVNGTRAVWQYAEGTASNICEVIDRIMSLDNN
jgi:hydroxymethylpyrimidine pyrophosphatase-like HAD family hydrolase